MPITRLKYKNAVIDESSQSLPVRIQYGDTVVAQALAGQTKTLKCGGKLMLSAVKIGSRTLNVANKFMESDIVAEVASFTPLNVPEISGTYVYSGESINPTISEYDHNKIAVSGDVSAVSAGSYLVTFSIVDKSGYMWADGTQNDKTASWSIGRKQYAIPAITGTYEYNKAEQTPTVQGFVSAAMTKSGDVSKTDAGSYSMLIGLSDPANTQWSNGSTEQIELSWTIRKHAVTIPIVTGSFTYDKGSHSATISGYDSDWIAQSGTASATDAGTYSITFELLDSTNTTWSDSSTTPKSGSWSISVRELAVPTIGNYQFTSGVITPSVSGFNSEYSYKNTSSGEFSGTRAGSYNAVFTLNDGVNTKWAGKSLGVLDAAVPWEITVRRVTIPSLSGTYTYDGNVKNVAVSGLDATFAQNASDTQLSGTNAGQYTAKWELIFEGDTTWSDGSTGTASKTWTINKSSAAKVSVSPTSHSWDADGDYSFTITNPSGGALTASSNATSYFTVPSGTLPSNTLVVTAQGRSSSKHTGTITITSAATENYNASTCTISCTLTATCVSGDTLVTLADRSRKRLDELTYDDEVLVWNFFTGSYDTAKSMMIFYHGDSEDYLDLRFSDGSQLKVIWSHELFDLDLMKWVEVSKENVAEYIGHAFAKAGADGIEPVELVSGTVVNESVTSWSAQTQQHANLVLGDMLTFTVQEYDGMYDLFSVDSSMKYKAEELANDIETYGLYTPEDFAPYGLDEQMFYAAGGQYFKILVGRGVITFDDVIKLIRDYLLEISKNSFVKKK